MTVAAGDIAFVAYSMDNTSEGFVFVVLNPIAAGDSITFVDGDRSNNTGQLNVDASVTWTNTTGAPIAAGTLVQVNFGSTATGGGSTSATLTGPGSLSAVNGTWNVDSADNIHAITATVGTGAVAAGSQGTHVAALIYGDNNFGTLTTGASIINPTGGNTNNDVGSITSTIAGTNYANAGAARTAYTTAGSWTQDTGVNNGTGGEWPALSDANSPLNGKVALTVETTAPTVSSVTYGSNDGLLGVGETVTLTVTFSEAVNVAGGTPTLTLNSGGTASYTSGTGTTQLVFTYTPATGESAADLAVTAFNLNGATVRDGSLNNANTTGAVTNPTGTLQVDGVAPSTPAITDVQDDIAATTGSVVDGGNTNDPDLLLSGTAEANATVTIFDNLVQIGTATANGSGNWSFSTGPLADGGHSFAATATDAAGNVSGTSVARTATLDTAADGDVAVDITGVVPGATPEAQFTLANLDAGSTAEVTFTGSVSGSVTYGYGSNGAQTADLSGLVGDVTAAVVVTDTAGNVAAGTGETFSGTPVCFYPGTLIATPAGDVAVETLQPGDLVLTAEGRAVPVRWMGRQTVSTRFGDPVRVLPIRIRAGALGEALPARDLLVSPAHALCIGGVLVNAGALVNGTTITRDSAVPERFTYWHIETAAHELVLAEGVAAETFVDNVEREHFDNWAEYTALVGEAAPIPEMELPRAKSARQVPMHVRAILAERAAVLQAGLAEAA